MNGIAGQYWATPPDQSAQSANKIIPIQVDKYGRLLFIAAEPVGGGVTWGAPVAVAMTGSSVTFIPANTARKALLYWNPTGNSAASYDLSGGTVTLAAGIPLGVGSAPSSLTGADCPVGIVTAIGTNTQNLYYVEGT